jgi:hypothetical protein
MGAGKMGTRRLDSIAATGSGADVRGLSGSGFPNPALFLLCQRLQMPGGLEELAPGVLDRDLTGEFPDLLSLPPILGRLIIARRIQGRSRLQGNQTSTRS